MPSATAAWRAATIRPRAPSTPVAAGSSRDSLVAQHRVQPRATGRFVDRCGRPAVRVVSREVTDRLAQSERACVIGHGDWLGGREQARVGEPRAQAVGVGEIVWAVLQVDRVDESLHEPQHARRGCATTGFWSHTIKLHSSV